jgi:uncharacterized protein YndB with AHSA1/START domain
MPYSYTLSAVIPASPAEIYRAWLDSVAHSEMTGSDATMSDEIGAEVSAWDGYITGRNLELVPAERIVQSWRTTEFADEFEDSIVTIVLQETEDGTLLTLEHSNVPDDQKGYEEGGWQSNYFEPMVVYFSDAEDEDTAEPEPEAAPPVSAPAAAAKVASGAGARRKARASGRRTVKSSGRKTKSAAATKKPKVAARKAKAAKKASSGAAKKASKKSSAKTSAKSAARRGAAKKARTSASRSRKSARGKRR